MHPGPAVIRARTCPLPSPSPQEAHGRFPGPDVSNFFQGWVWREVFPGHGHAERLAPNAATLSWRSAPGKRVTGEAKASWDNEPPAFTCCSQPTAVGNE